MDTSSFLLLSFLFSFSILFVDSAGLVPVRTYTPAESSPHSPPRRSHLKYRQRPFPTEYQPSSSSLSPSPDPSTSTASLQLLENTLLSPSSPLPSFFHPAPPKQHQTHTQPIPPTQPSFGLPEFKTPNPSRMRQSVFPARRVCERGWLDSSVDACVFYDKEDKVLPRLSCPSGSVLEGSFCYGQIRSDMELHCPKDFDVNLDELCVKAVVYSPTRVICPEGFEIRRYTEAKLKQCVKTVYVKPITKKVKLAEEETGHCDSIKDRYCPKFAPQPVPQPSLVLECSEGRLIRLKDTAEAVCRVRVLVQPTYRDTCIQGYRWTQVEGSGGACMHLSALSPSSLCPGPTPKLGPGLGDWETPKYKLTNHGCLAFRAKALTEGCPIGYEYVQGSCYRKLFLPYFYDCNNIEGYGFRWSEREDSGECEFEFDTFKWSAGTGHLTRKQEFQNLRIQLFSNPYEVKRAYAAGRQT